MIKSTGEITTKHIILGLGLLILGVVMLYVVKHENSKLDGELLANHKERAFYYLVNQQYDLINGPIHTFTQVKGLYSLSDEVLEKTYKECSPLLFKELTADSFEKIYTERLKQPNLPVYQPTYNCINKIVEPIPLSEREFINFVNAPRFDKYKNVPEVKKVIATASEDNVLTSGEAFTIIDTIDLAEKQIAMDKFKNKQGISDDVK